MSALGKDVTMDDLRATAIAAESALAEIRKAVKFADREAALVALQLLLAELGATEREAKAAKDVAALVKRSRGPSGEPWKPAAATKGGA